MILKFRSLFILSFIAVFVCCISFDIKAQCHFSSGPLGELCTSAKYICGSDFNGFSDRLPKKLSVAQPWSGLCNGSGNADNIVWFSFTPCSTIVTLEITPSNCTLENNTYQGVQAGMFSACNKSASVACTDHSSGNGVTTTFTLTSNSFIPGVTGYLFLDGYAGSVCDFTIKVIDGIDTSFVMPPDASLLSDGYVTGRNVIECEEKQTPITYTITVPQCQVNVSQACGQNPINPLDSICYVWNVIPSIGSSFLNQDSVGKSIKLLFSQPGQYTISAQSFFHPFYGGSCANAACGKINSWEVEVMSPDTVINAPIYICPGNSLPYCNTIIDRDTTLLCQIDSCNFVQQPFIMGTSNVNLLGTQYICAASAFVFQNVSYNIPGSYEVIDINDCSLLHKFTVIAVDVKVDILTSLTTLNCNNTEINLMASGSTNGPASLNYVWRNSAGTIVSSSSLLKINTPGKYNVQVNYNINGSLCTDSKEIIILQDIKKPSLQAFIPKLRCKGANEPPSVLTLSTSDLLTFSQWTAPNGVITQGLNIIVDSLNASSGLPYKFVAIGSNGCRLDTSFTIESNFEKAAINLIGDDITCFNTKSLLTLSTSISVDSVRWSRVSPNPAFFGSEQDKKSIITNVGGRYEAKVMASASKCWSAGEKEILDRIFYPVVDAGIDLKWHCNTKQLDINPSVSLGNEFVYSWKTNGGNISSANTDRKLTLTQPGEYILNVINNTNGCERSDSVVILRETNVPSQLEFDAYDINCFGQKDGEIEIINVIGGFGPYSYFLNGKELSNSLVSNLSPGSYKIEVKDIYDCSHEVDIQINEPLVFNIDAPLEIEIAYSESSSISFQSNYPNAEIVDIKWINGKKEIIGTDFKLDIIGEKSDIISLEVVTVNGCTSRAKIKLNVDTQVDLYFPNIFSPNGDNVNDRFVIYKNKIPAQINRLSIFDRYGNKVYEKSNFEFNENQLGWDGTFNNKPVSAGVYVYIVEYADYLGIKHIIKKDLTIVR